MAASGGMFSAEDVFKHFVHPVPPYDSRIMNMSREAYQQHLIDQGLIKDEHDQNVQCIKAVTNRKVRVHGRFKRNGTLVIHLVESSPPPPIAPPRWPIWTSAILKDRMYYMLGFEDIPGKIEFAGKPSEVWSKHTLNERTVWRVVFGGGRGRRKGTRNYPPPELLLAMEKAIREIITHHPHQRVSKTAVAKRLGTTYRQLQIWLTEDHVDFEELCLSLDQPKNNSTV